MLRAIPPFLRGRKGSKYKNTPDTIRSEDSVEAILGVGEGDNFGLAEGAKSFQIGGTALVNSNGEANFSDFQLTEYTGVENPPAIIPALGGFGSPTAANASSLATNTAVTRTGQLTNIDYIDLRFLINQLHRSDDKGIYTWDLRIKIEYRQSLPAGQPWQLAWANVIPPPPGYNEDTTTPGVNVYTGGTTDVDYHNDVVTFDGDNLYLRNDTSPGAPIGDFTNIWVHPTTGRPYVYSGGSWVVAPGTVDNGTSWTYGSTKFYKNPTTPPPNPSVGDVWTPPGGTEPLRFNGTSWIISLIRSIQNRAYAQPMIGQTNGVMSLTQKVTSPTVREVRVPVPRAGVPYDIRVTKLSEDTSTDGKKVSEVGWESFEEIVAEGRSFPNTHILHIIGRASDQFNSLPELTGDIKGRIVEVPTNYDVVTRTYTGIWDGLFKKAWTDNGAWCTRDFIKNNRYGLSTLYPYEVREASFYNWATWCDVAVPDNKGGSRPRWTYNDVLDQPRQAKEQANYMAGSSGGRLIDDGSGIYDVLIDKDEPMTMVFGPESVVDGEFTYSFTDIQTRANWIKVGFVNPDLNWEVDFRVIKDQPHIDEYGRIPLEFVAAGKTNVSEALAAARLRLITGTTEYTAVTFQTNRQGKYLFPFKTIGICDPDMGWGISGRISGINSLTQIRLRDPVYLEAGINYKFVFNLPTSPITTVSLDAAPGQSGSLTAVNLVTNSRTNKVSRDATNFTGGLLGITKAGDPALVLTVVDDTDALVEAELAHLATSGQVVKVDNSAGVASAAVVFQTLVALPSVQHTFSAYVRGAGGTNWTLRGGGSVVTTFQPTAGYQRITGQRTPTTTNETLRVYIPAGAVAYVVLPQLEEGAVATKPIPWSGASGTTTTVSELSDLSEFAQFAIESYDAGGDPIGTPKPFKILTITPGDGDSELVEITALELNRSKWPFVDGTGELLPAEEYSSFKGDINKPQNVKLVPTTETVGGLTKRNLQVQWDQPSNPFARNTLIEYSRDGNNFVKIGESESEFYEVKDVSSGVHAIRLTHVHIDGVRKSLSVLAIHEVTSDYRIIPVVTDLVMADEPSPTVFESISPMFRWAHGEEDPNFKNYRVRVRNASTSAIVRTEDVTIREFIYDFDKNKADFGGTPSRAFKICVTKVDDYGSESTEVQLSVSNTAPAAPTLTVTGAIGGVNVTLSPTTERDVIGARLQVDTVLVPLELQLDATQSNFFVPLPNNDTRFIKGAYYDRFDKTTVNWSAQSSATRQLIDSSAIDSTPPAVPTGLALSSPTVTLDPVTGAPIVKLIATWTANTEGDLYGYETEITESGGSPVVQGIGSARNEWIVKANTSYSVRVRAVDDFGNRSAWSSTSTLTSAKDNVGPGLATSLSVTALFQSFVVSWTNATDKDLAYVQILESVDSNIANATVIDTVRVNAAAKGSYVREGLAGGVTRFYWVRGIDTSGNIGSSALAGTGTTNRLVSGDFPTNLPPIEVFGSLPSTGNFQNRQVRLTTDNKLYTWTHASITTGTTYWSASVAATDITGQLVDSQLAALAATKITGQLTNAQIQSITASKISDVLVAGQIPGLDAAKIISGQFDGSRILDGAITNAKLVAGLAGIETVSALPSTANFRGRTVMLQSDGKLYRWNSTTTTGTTFWDKSASGADIVAGTITGDRLVAGTIQAAQIGAGAITASKLLIGDTSNMIPDPDFSDFPTGYLNSGGGLTGSVLVSATGMTLASKNVVRTITTAAGGWYTASIPVEPNKPYYISGYMANVDTVAPLQARLYIYWFKADGTQSTVKAQDLIASTTVAGRYSGTYVCPSDATIGRIRAYVNGAAPSGVDYGEFIMRRAANGELIVDGSIVAGKIAAGAVTAGTIAAGVVGANEIAAGAITTVKLAAGAVTANELAANSVTALQIAAKAITTDKMLIAPGNLIPNSDFATGDLTNWRLFTAAGTVAVVAAGAAGVPTGAPSAYVAKVSPSAGAAGLFAFSKAYDDAGAGGDGFVVTPGEKYQVSLDLVKTATYAGATLIIYAYFWKSDGSYTTSLTALAVPAVSMGTTWGTFEAEFTAPTGALRCWPYVYIGSVTAGNVYWTNLRVVQKASGRLIVDGAITAVKIAAASITGDRLVAGTIQASHIATGTITADRLAAGTLTATQIQAGSITGDRLVAGTITATQIAAGTITATQISAGTITGDRLVAGTLTATQIQAGSITGDRLQANTITAVQIAADTITASRLRLGDTSNMVIDPDQVDTTLWQGTATRVFVAATDTVASKNVIQLTSAGYTSRTFAGLTPVEPGKPYAFHIAIWCATTTAVATIQWVTKAGADIAGSAVTLGTRTNNGSIGRYDLIATAPANAAFVYISYSNSTNGQTAVFAEPAIRRAANAELIVDGSITAVKISAGSITGDRLTAGTITSTQIQAGSITADRLNVTNLSAISANLGSVTAGSININNKFIVASDGTLTIQNAASGARLVVTNSLIQVYDASNVLRVRLGIW